MPIRQWFFSCCRNLLTTDLSTGVATAVVSQQRVVSSSNFCHLRIVIFPLHSLSWSRSSFSGARVLSRAALTWRSNYQAQTPRCPSLPHWPNSANSDYPIMDYWSCIWIISLVCVYFMWKIVYPVLSVDPNIRFQCCRGIRLLLDLRAVLHLWFCVYVNL